MLDESKSSFRPRDSRDNESVSGCDQHPGDCKPEYVARLTPIVAYDDPLTGDPVVLQGHIKFDLEGLSSALPGSSTNYGDSTQHDYIIDRAIQESYFGPVTTTTDSESIQTSEETAIAKLKVSSMDYGGKAKLKATLMITTSIEGTPAEWVAQAVSVGARFDYASLPVDRDSNGIADSWEYPLSAQGLMPSDDLDQRGDSTTGDGFAVIEEYRGFHYAERVGTTTTVKWTSTNPVSDLDLFVWDYHNTFHSDLEFFKNQFPFLKVWEVNLDTASLSPSLTSAMKINTNTNSQIETFPILLVWDDSIQPAAFCTSSQVGGALAQGPFNPYPARPDGRPIRFANNVMDSCPASLGLADRRSAFRQMLVAHEFGHVLNLRHPCHWRQPETISYSESTPPVSLPLGKYSYNSSKPQELFTWLKTFRLNNFDWPVEQVVHSITSIDGPYDNNQNPGWRLYRHGFSNALAPPLPQMLTLSSLMNDDTHVNVMNAFTRLDRLDVSQNSFSASDRSAVCLNGSCSRAPYCSE